MTLQLHYITHTIRWGDVATATAGGGDGGGGGGGGAGDRVAAGGHGLLACWDSKGDTIQNNWLWVDGHLV